MHDNPNACNTRTNFQQNRMASREGNAKKQCDTHTQFVLEKKMLSLCLRSGIPIVVCSDIWCIFRFILKYHIQIDALARYQPSAHAQAHQTIHIWES